MLSPYQMKHTFESNQQAEPQKGQCMSLSPQLTILMPAKPKLY